MYAGPTAALTHQRLEPLKWLALISMVVDHVGKTVLPEWAAPCHAVGRLAFPLFIYIFAVRLALRPTLDVVYLRRLLPWAIIAQPAYTLISGAWVGNILCLLAAGAAAHLGARVALEGQRGRGLVVICAAVAAGAWCEYGPLGAALPAILAALHRRDPELAAGACGPLGFLAQIPMSTSMLPWNLWAVLASGPALLALQIPLKLPRLPRWAFYGFYPAHLYLLYGLTV